MAETDDRNSTSRPKQGYNARRGRNNQAASKNDVDVDENSPVIQAFRVFQEELDKRYEKYERIVKRGRDVTFESKKVIFLLHRITGDSNKQSIIQEAEDKLREIGKIHFKEIAVELIGEDFYQFLRAFSPGLQEYVEARTYLSYLKDGSLISICDIKKDLIFTHTLEGSSETLTISMPLPQQEYILGVADLTGELMRKCINSVAQGNIEEPLKVAALMKPLYEGFYSIGNMGGKEIWRKTVVLKQSLNKVENACYTIRVRRSEFPESAKIADRILSDVFSSSYGGNPNLSEDMYEER